MIKNIELIIFDLDGTLVDSKQDIINAINFMLKEMSLPEKSNEEIISYVGKGIDELLVKSLESQDTDVNNKGLALFKSYYEKHPADHAYLYKGVEETLKYFKNKQKAVITNRNHKSALNILKKMGIYTYFTRIIGDDNKLCLKPSRDQFDKLFDILSVKKKDKIIMIGDMDVDIIAAKASGVLTCAVTYGFGKFDDIRKLKPDYIIDSISELKNIIN